MNAGDMNLSVVMSVYNEEKFVNKAISSILDQTFPDFELIIVDDGSTDNTPQIIESFAKRDNRIRFLRNAQNKGKSESLNVAISLSKGEIIALMDGDDISLPERLEKQLDFLKRNPEVGLVGVKYWEIDEDDSVVNRVIYPRKLRGRSLKRMLYKRNFFAGGSLMFRKSLFEKVGGFNVHFVVSEDFDFILRVGEISKIAIVDEVLYLHRLKPSSISFRAGKLMKEFHLLAIKASKIRESDGDDKTYVARQSRRILERYGLPSNKSLNRARQDVCYTLNFKARMALRKGNHRKARETALKSFKQCRNLSALRLIIISFLPHRFYNLILEIRDILKVWALGTLR